MLPPLAKAWPCRCNMDGGIQHQGGWLSEHETTHNFFHPQKGKGDGPPTHRGGAGSNFCVLASSRPFREGGEGGAARETYMVILDEAICLIVIAKLC